jgi:hypothetical protein
MPERFDPTARADDARCTALDTRWTDDDASRHDRTTNRPPLPRPERVRASIEPLRRPTA